jgi:hypothetical protein
MGISFHLRTTAFVLAAALVSGQLIKSFPVNASIQTSDASFEHFLQVRAIVSDKGALVEWRTGSEPDTLGFNIFRIKNRERTQLNPGLIAGSALIARGHPQTLSWFDKQGTIDCVYEVESVDLRGESAAHISAAPVWQASLPEFQPAPLLSTLGATSRTAAVQSELPETDGAKDRSQTSASLSGESLAEQWANANLPALKIGIRADGWYRVSQPQMATAGFDTSGDARNLRLFVGGNEIAISVSRETGALGPGDFIEFWGQGLDTPTTDTQVYWLINGAQAGLRITTKGELRPDASAIKPAPLPAASPGSRSWSFSLAGDVLRAVLPGQTEPRRERNTSRAEEVPGPIEPVLPIPGEPEAKAPELTKRRGVSSSVSSSPLTPETNVLPEPKPVNSSIAESKPMKPAKALKARTTRSALRSAKPRGRRNRSRLKPQLKRRNNHPILTDTPSPAFVYSLLEKEHSVYYSAGLNGDEDNFFGPVIVGDGPTVTLTLRNIETTSPAPAQLQVALQGVSLETHQVRIFVNDTLAGTITFPDQTAATQTFAIPTSWLHEGNNAIKLGPVGSSHDTSVMESLRITYPHSFRAENDSLQFSVRANQRARIDGFTTANLRLLDITNPSAVEEIRPAVEGAGGGFATTIPSTGIGKARRMIVLPATRLSQPDWLAVNQPSTLNRSTNAANFVIISYKDFIPALAPLVAQRQAQGFSVAVINVEDVFDEFSYGTHTPQAIKDFILLAKNNWAQSPSYLLLVGDASYDPRNYLGAGNFDFVPSKQIDTGTPGAATALETASDDWLVDFDGDGIADISVGRLPVRTTAEANLMVSKIVNYSPGNTVALLVADTQGSYYFNFETASDQVGALLPAAMTVQKIYRRLQPSDAAARANIISKFNSGPALAVYSGHGNVNVWGGSIFTATDAAALTNGNRLPFVVVMDCLNGYFADPSLQSLSEAFLQAPNGGAVASFASSGLTIPDGQHEMGLRMFQLLYGGASIPIGDASRQAKAATTDRDVRRTWILLGDPTLKIR